MPSYRIYMLGHDGRILSGRNITCANDEDAREAAQWGLSGGGEAEVWIGTRCLGRVSERRPQSSGQPCDERPSLAAKSGCRWPSATSRVRHSQDPMVAKSIGSDEVVRT